ncbi:SurA N-terminal domain-containing protein [Paracandidimonas lactea]|uniref:SurA N-terminal domain-containing protein n=1 Tax=Paracandidimonas lactea TaxID=2895524 RepID=UPI001F3F473B|nr:SurA N-terminal domain-containing protein [Paracandidimonas lactea]
MFDFIRSHQRLMQLILLILILPSFVLIGVSGYTNYVSGDRDLVKVGDSAITQQVFDQARNNQMRQLQQTMQGGFDPAVVDNPQARKALLDQLIERQVLINAATSDRFSISDTALRQAIATMPQFQVEGSFSPERYNQILASAGLSPRDFEAGQRAELAIDRVLGPVGDSALVPGEVLDRIERTLTAQRSIRLRSFPATDYEKDIVITDADIQAWYDKNKDSLQLPEQVTAQYILLNEKAAMSNLPAVTDQQLRDYYEQNKARYVRPARVNVSHIQVTVPAGASGAQRTQAQEKAQKILERLRKAPDTFAEVAKAESQDAGTAADGGKLGWITQGSWPANLESAVFGLQAGQISGVIDGPSGYHIFRVNERQAEQGESFEQARAKVETEVRRQLGSERFADMATKLTSLAYDNATSLDPAAQALGLKVHTAAGITRDRLLSADEVPANAASASPDAALLDDVRVRRALFSAPVLNEKQNSGVIEISPDTMLVVRAHEVIPAHVPELAQVTDHIRATLKAERALQAATKAGEQLLAALRNGETGPATEEGFGTVQSVSRIDPKGLPKVITDAAFAVPADKLPAFQGVTGPQGYVVVRIEGAQAGTVDSPQLAGLQSDLSRVWGQAEEKAVLEVMRQRMGVKVLPEAEKAIQGESREG